MRPLKVVVVGGGVAALEVCLGLQALAGDRVELVMVAPEPAFEFKPAAVGEPFGVSAVRRFDLAEVARGLGAELHRGTASAVEVDQGRLLVDGWRPVSYDALVLAAGAIPIGAVPGAITFAGPKDVPVVKALIAELATSGATRLVVAIPDTAWTLPAYELALLAGAHLRTASGDPAQIAIVTPERSPLWAFGAVASADVRRLLMEREIAFHGLRTPVEVHGGVLRTSPGGSVRADRVVALPRLRGVRIDGLPVNSDGFLRTDTYGRVADLPDVYAAGDMTDFPVKQGGIATQQADVVAEMIAADAGAPVTPRPFRPHLRGLLLTGDGERFLSADIAGGPGGASEADSEPGWWPPVKIPGRFLGPYLAGVAADERLQSETSQR
ncbi:MAG TPA: FAD-dependent oxidoreductase [Gaiellales bacterium]